MKWNLCENDSLVVFLGALKEGLYAVLRPVIIFCHMQTLILVCSIIHRILTPDKFYIKRKHKSFDPQEGNIFNLLIKELIYSFR